MFLCCLTVTTCIFTVIKKAVEFDCHQIKHNIHVGCKLLIKHIAFFSPAPHLESSICLFEDLLYKSTWKKNKKKDK